MSFLGLGGSGPSAISSPQKIAAAEAELDMVTDMFNRLVESCHSKCITTKYDNGELSNGESLCLDRCVAKYFDVNIKVGEVSIFSQLEISLYPIAYQTGPPFKSLDIFVFY
ncbi:hypothetical protein NADFUDRAFT_83937 [Nadsonia fulvescens var. elongata DSM 6958]|uniref:Mitochondrial import inner membrane translocase subunit n=1 Tax=Nadsonia fulvescens var. elongata DSM 6958 TaxID=857566 RepID=A0A1E3PEJ7_9ASCO|nr:hypothetical protein NADFUDRAFT_83937 [Nadsonia fulvescens var. elongata DSM 6958]